MKGSRGSGPEGRMSMLWRGWSLTCLVLFVCASVARSEENKVHIVYMGNHHSDLPKDEVTSHHHRILAEALGSVEAVEDSIIYSYKHLFSGFAARLSQEQIGIISNTEGVMSVFPSSLVRTQTSHSWNFLGLDDAFPSANEHEHFKSLNVENNLWGKTSYGKDAIIGVIDTGVWPESPSFNDDGFDPVPSRFKGTCESGDSFPESSCNKKLIGARYYVKSYQANHRDLSANMTASNDTFSPRDAHGHGTHTASTAAGRFSTNASENGWGLGTVKGGAPFARLAIYKACWIVTAGDDKGSAECSVPDVLKAMDDATADGVDIMSLSIGGSKSVPFFDDGISVGTYHAVEKNILIVMAAGNNGPNVSSVANLHPWTMSVAASTIDRDLRESITLGNQQQLFGYTQGSQTGKDTTFSLVFAGNVGLPNADKVNTSLCVIGTLDPAKVKGKVVLCLRGTIFRTDKMHEVMRAGGAGVIIANTNASADLSRSDGFPLLGCNVDFETEQHILAYINGTRDPTVKFGQKNFLGVKGAPSIPLFSSVGPNGVVPDILKPDITAPGDSILAAWTGNTANIQPLIPGSKVVPLLYKLSSGTSMATPHVSGTAALLKSLYPHWSPAAIKSAIMTTATVVDNNGQPIKDSRGNQASPFQMGGGLLHPNAAADPGLVYDAGSDDYVVFLCALRYNSTQIKIVTGVDHACPSTRPPSASDLNMPSVTIANLGKKRTIKRTVTNVGNPNSVYTFESSCPPNVRVTVFPTELHFKRQNEKKNIYVTFERTSEPTEEWSFGSFTWTDSTFRYRVRSPVVLGAMNSW